MFSFRLPKQSRRSQEALKELDQHDSSEKRAGDAVNRSSGFSRASGRRPQARSRSRSSIRRSPIRRSSVTLLHSPSDENIERLTHHARFLPLYSSRLQPQSGRSQQAPQTRDQRDGFRGRSDAPPTLPSQSSRRAASQRLVAYESESEDSYQPTDYASTDFTFGESEMMDTGEFQSTSERSAPSEQLHGFTVVNKGKQRKKQQDHTR